MQGWIAPFPMKRRSALPTAPRTVLGKALPSPLRTAFLTSLFVALPLVAVGCGSDGGGGAGPDPSAPASISVSPREIVVTPGATVQVTATVRDGAGNVMTVPVTWTSFNPAVATVSSSGLVTGVADGSTRIGAAVQGIGTDFSVDVIEPLGFEFPMDGVLETDFYLLNYLDKAGPGQVQDHTCGPKSYDGHQGVDITLRSFAQMDSLVAIVAPLTGSVVYTEDGHFDRNKDWSNGGGFANHVVLDHGRGYTTYYGHMMKNSVAVSVGEIVQVGDTLGFVGSAGTSDIPHLHFEVRRNNIVVDPYTGSCSTPISHWAEQGPYQDGFQLIDADVTLALMNLDLAKDRAPVADTVVMGRSGRLTAWVQYVNVRPNAMTEFRVLRPDGSVAREYAMQHQQFYSLSWWWAWWDLGGWIDTTGEWALEIRQGGQALARRPFRVVEGAAGAWGPATEEVRQGGGGGGLDRPAEGILY